MKKHYLLFAAFIFWGIQLRAQDPGLLSLLGSDKTIDYATASFKTNRIVNGHSIENTAKGVLDVKVSHRFGPARQGLYDLFGLDGANVRIGADYGITDRLMVGFGRNSLEKLLDGFVKYKILWQCTGQRNIPVTVSYLIDAQLRMDKFSNPDRTNYFTSRLYYTHQLLIGRKFNDVITLQLVPTLIHRNLVATKADKNDVYAVGVGGRIRLSRRVTFNAEYYYVPDGQITTAHANSLSLGFDIETGGHVFQFHFTNSQDMTYRGFITETQHNWFYKGSDGRTLSDVRFGFNISRVFTIVKPKINLN